MVLLAMNSMLLNQLYTYSKLLLNRNTHGIKLYIDWLTKQNVVTKGLWEPVFPPRGNGSVFTNSVFRATL